MESINSIAIDGPAASGKSTLAKMLADHLDFMFFDTGVMYRAVTHAALARGFSTQDEAACTKLAQTIDIDIRPASQDDGRQNDLLVDGEDCTWKIRQPEVDQNVSVVAAYAGVRQALTAQQRKIGLRGSVVMVGRDIGTVVIPEARRKIYLDASVEERARRRYDELLARGAAPAFETVLADMQRRDDIDASRDVAPLKAADDAAVIDSDGKDIQAVFEEMMALVKK